nr:uncharacterized protein LOC121502044 [Drosophila kikkawai]
MASSLVQTCPRRGFPPPYPASQSAQGSHAGQEFPPGSTTGDIPPQLGPRSPRGCTSSRGSVTQHWISCDQLCLSAKKKTRGKACGKWKAARVEGVCWEERLEFPPPPCPPVPEAAWVAKKLLGVRGLVEPKPGTIRDT